MPAAQHVKRQVTRAIIVGWRKAKLDPLDNGRCPDIRPSRVEALSDRPSRVARSLHARRQGAEGFRGVGPPCTFPPVRRNEVAVRERCRTDRAPTKVKSRLVLEAPICSGKAIPVSGNMEHARQSGDHFRNGFSGCNWRAWPGRVVIGVHVPNVLKVTVRNLSVFNRL
jgi:hypothetical protein